MLFECSPGFLNKIISVSLVTDTIVGWFLECYISIRGAIFFYGLFVQHICETDRNRRIGGKTVLTMTSSPPPHS